MVRYVTLFDHRYAGRGEIMMKSLRLHHKGPWQLDIVAMDQIAETEICLWNEPRVKVHALTSLLTPELIEIKNTRTITEFYWTMTPFVLQAMLHKYQETVTYLDADLCFYSDPQILINEYPEAPILITEHRYSWWNDQQPTAGRFCVQFLTIRPTELGEKALKWWTRACRKWCHSWYEDGKFGDQKYLDDWLVRFPGTKVIEHPGAGLAPWNVTDYSLKIDSGVFRVKRRKTKKWDDLIFFHFHQTTHLGNGKWELGPYHLPQAWLDFIYQPYIEALTAFEKKIFSKRTARRPAVSFLHGIRRRYYSIRTLSATHLFRYAMRHIPRPQKYLYSSSNSKAEIK